MYSIKYNIIYIAIIQDGGSLQPLPRKAKEHDGKSNWNLLMVKMKMIRISWWRIHVDIYFNGILNGHPSYVDHIVLITCWSYFKAFSMGTQVTSPGAKAPDKEKVQEILKVSPFWCWAKKEILKVSQFWYWAKKRDLKGEPILVTNIWCWAKKEISQVLFLLLLLDQIWCFIVSS